MVCCSKLSRTPAPARPQINGLTCPMAWPHSHDMTRWLLDVQQHVTAVSWPTDIVNRRRGSLDADNRHLESNTNLIWTIQRYRIWNLWDAKFHNVTTDVRDPLSVRITYTFIVLKYLIPTRTAKQAFWQNADRQTVCCSVIQSFCDRTTEWQSNTQTRRLTIRVAQSQ